MSQVTKRALVASLKNQLLKKPLDKVTISDITDDCGISRMTFYYHFKAVPRKNAFGCALTTPKYMNLNFHLCVSELFVKINKRACMFLPCILK